MKNKTHHMETKIRLMTVGFMIVLIISGITAMPVKPEIEWLLSVVPENLTPVHQWLKHISGQLVLIDGTILYGFDWLAFAHICIAISFYGVIKDPVRNIWIVDFGIICSFLIIPFTLIAGHTRHIPGWWQLIDCSFGVFALIPLFVLRKWILEFEKQIKTYSII